MNALGQLNLGSDLAHRRFQPNLIAVTNPLRLAHIRIHQNAVGITAFAEAITCMIGFIIYLVSGKAIDWKLVAMLVICATLAVPFAALTVRKAPSDRLKAYVGILMAVLGIFTILKISSGS